MPQAQPELRAYLGLRNHQRLYKVFTHHRLVGLGDRLILRLVLAVRRRLGWIPSLFNDIFHVDNGRMPQHRLDWQRRVDRNLEEPNEVARLKLRRAQRLLSGLAGGLVGLQRRLQSRSLPLRPRTSDEEVLVSEVQWLV